MSDLPPQPSQPSNYYRPPADGGPKIDFDVIGQAWNLVKPDLGTWIVAGLIMFVLLVAAEVVNFMLAKVLGTFLSLLVALPFGLLIGGVFFVLQCGALNMAVKKARGESISSSDVTEGFSRFGPLFVTGLLYALALDIGFILCVLPMYYVMAVLAFAPLIAMREPGLAPVDVLKKSYETLKSQALMMFALVFVLGFIAGLGAIACGIGMVVTWPIFFAGIALTYLKFFPEGDGTPADLAPPTPVAES